MKCGQWPDNQCGSNVLMALLLGGLLLPIATLFAQGIGAPNTQLMALAPTVLGHYLRNTLVLMLAVMGGCACCGVVAAWLVARCQFPGRGLLQWALLLPLAMPAYLVAYVYTDLLDYAGPLQRQLRHWFGWQSAQDYPFFEVRSVAGVSVMFTLVLFPYVYLLARTAFGEQAGSLPYASRVLGCSPWGSFWRVSLPLARPALMVGLALVAMETVADFATVHYFAVPTLTTAVYDLWLDYGSLAAAAQLACWMLLGLLGLVALERYGRRQQRLYQRDGSTDERRYLLRGWRAFLASGFCWGLWLLGFGLPAAVLAHYAVAYGAQSDWWAFATFGRNSFLLALVTALCVLAIALWLQWQQRRRASAWPSMLASYGYAMPGTVLAIGVVIPLTWLDFQLNAALVWFGFGAIGLWFSGSMVALLFAYVVRFLAIALGGVESAYKRLAPQLDMAAATLGAPPTAVFYRVHIPLLWRGLLTTALLVFIEAMKELPAALLLKPIGVETLATYLYQFVSDEALEFAALPALVIVALGLWPVWWLHRHLWPSSMAPTQAPVRLRAEGLTRLG
ncbi:MAG: iron ABC transporter permease [Ferrimonas sp.]